MERAILLPPHSSKNLHKKLFGVCAAETYAIGLYISAVSGMLLHAFLKHFLYVTTIKTHTNIATILWKHF